jgi:hypothetical protein
VFAGLLVLSIGGIAIADFSVRFGLYYWLVMVPIFAGASLFTGWTRARDRGESIHQILWRQALHWLALALAVYLVFMLEHTGRLNRRGWGHRALLVGSPRRQERARPLLKFHGSFARTWSPRRSIYIEASGSRRRGLIRRSVAGGPLPPIWYTSAAN